MNFSEKKLIRWPFFPRGKTHNRFPSESIPKAVSPKRKVHISPPAKLIPQLVCLKGKSHSSRGHRPRQALKGKLCPVRAIHTLPFFTFDAAIIAHSVRAHHFLHQTAPALVGERHKAANLGLPVSHSSNAGMQFDNHWRGGRSCAYPLQSSKKARPDESTGITEKRFFEVCKDARFESFGFSLAGRIWAFRRQPVPLSCSPGIYFRSGRTSHEANVSRGTAGHSQKIRSAIRRTLFVGLRGFWIALSGRDGSLIQLPRALPSAKMVQAFGLVSFRLATPPHRCSPLSVARSCFPNFKNHDYECCCVN
jgi:hypothetical protein